ncbi:hypothetical protein [Marinobacter sp.]|uniref:hypothetical protein n=1 Tax=Marinobacter sp. TaxID=50741 RepID=UPI00384A730F
MNHSRFNPAYVQISAAEAAQILGISIEELNHRRRTDSQCPAGFVEREHWMASMRFRLSDIYVYSDAIMKASIPASTHPNVDKAHEIRAVLEKVRIGDAERNST